MTSTLSSTGVWLCEVSPARCFESARCGRGHSSWCVFPFLIITIHATGMMHPCLALVAVHCLNWPSLLPMLDQSRGQQQRNAETRRFDRREQSHQSYRWQNGASDDCQRGHRTVHAIASSSNRLIKHLLKKIGEGASWSPTLARKFYDPLTASVEELIRRWRSLCFHLMCCSLDSKRLASSYCKTFARIVHPRIEYIRCKTTILLDHIRSLLSDHIHRPLDMLIRHNRKYASIHDPLTFYPVHPQSLINNTSRALRQHSAGPGCMPHGQQCRLDILQNCVVVSDIGTRNNLAIIRTDSIL